MQTEPLPCLAEELNGPPFLRLALHHIGIDDDLNAHSAVLIPFNYVLKHGAIERQVSNDHFELGIFFTHFT